MDRVAIGSFEPELLFETQRREPAMPLIGIVEEVARLEDMAVLPLTVLAVDTPLAEKALQLAPSA